MCKLYLQELIQRLLAALQLVQDGDQRVSDACPGAQRSDSVVPLDIPHYGPARGQEVSTALNAKDSNIASAFRLDKNS